MGKIKHVYIFRKARKVLLHPAWACEKNSADRISLERWGKRELPKVKLFACSVTIHPQCLMQGLAWRRRWASIYETTVEELPGGRGGSQGGLDALT